MSWTTSSATATCTIPGHQDSDSLALAVYDYLVNHPDEIPECLDEADSDEVVSTIKSYLALQGDSLVISYDTEDIDNYDADIFDFLTSHFACLQSSLFMEVVWIVEDSADGSNAGVGYYDRSGNPIDVRAALASYLTKS